MRSHKGKKRTHERAGMHKISEDSDDYVMDDYEDKAEENVVENRRARNFIDDMLGDYSDFYLNQPLGKREAMNLGVSGNAKEPETPAPKSVHKSEHRASPKPDPQKSRTPKVIKRREVPDDICKLLGIQKNATDAEIKKAYKDAVRMYHPDKTLNDPDKEAKEEQFKKISDYYDKTGLKAKTKKKRRRKRTKKPKRKHA
jgi:DnaJ-domain-containing protein 1